MNKDMQKLFMLKSEKWFALESGESEESATLHLYGVIGGDWFDEGVNAEEISRWLEKLSAKTLNVKINSPGGSVWDGWAIFNSLRAWKFGGMGCEIVVHIDGCAGSIASLIAMAGDRIIMPVASQIFVHNPWMFASGNAKQFENLAHELRDMETTMCRVYMERTGQDESTIRELMNGVVDGTFLSAERALELGFCTEVLENIKAAACIGSEILGKISGNVDTQRIDAQNIVNTIYRNTRILTTKG